MFQGSKNVPGEYFTLRREGRREPAGRRRQRHDQQRPHELLRDRAVGQPREPALARVRSPGHAARRHRHRRSSTTSATSSRTSGARASRTAVRPLVHARRSRTLFPAGHPYSWPVIGSHGGPHAPRRSTTCRSSSGATTRRTTCRWSSPATSIRPRRSAWSRSTSACIPPGPALDRPARWIPALERREDRRGRPTACRRSGPTWPGPRPSTSTPDEAALDLASLHPHRRPVVAPEQGARLRQAAVHRRSPRSTIVMEIAGVVRRAGHGAARASSLAADRSDRHRARSRASPRPARPPAELDRARTKQEFDVRVRPGAHRRLRRQGRSAQSVQHLPRRSRQVRRGPRALPRASPSATCAGAVEQVARTRATALLLRFHPGRPRAARPRRRWIARRRRRSATDRPFKAPEVKTAKLDNGLGGLRRRAPRPAEGGGDARHARRRDRRSGRQGRRSRSMVDAHHRHGHEDAQGAARSRTRSAISARRSTAPPTREYSRVGFEVLKRNLVAGARHRLRRGAQRVVPRRRKSTREKKRQLDALAQQDKNPNAVAARVRGDARLRRRSSVRPPGAGPAVETVEAIDARRPRRLPPRRTGSRAARR